MIEARWRSLADGGLQRVTLATRDNGWHAVGEVRGDHSLTFDLVCDGEWRARTLSVTLVLGENLHLQDDGRGGWQSDGKALPHLDGCIDVDLVATPFTNTLPIRRLELAQGAREEIRVAYIEIPDLSVHAAPQAYTCLEVARRYLYESLDYPFTAELNVDPDGIVCDYPGLFERLGAG